MVQFWRISVSRVCIFCQGNLYFCKLPVLFFGSVFWFTGVRHFASKDYNLEGRNDFSFVLLMNSDQLYLPKFN